MINVVRSRSNNVHWLDNAAAVKILKRGLLASIQLAD
jgi:hypothetical protein